MLTATATIKVRFNETDPLGITWHGHYVTYFEDGREAFGTKYGLHYLDIFKNGFVAPIVNLNCDFKKMLRYGESVLIETSFEDSHAAKIIFKYTLYNAATSEILATGSTTQVFLDIEKQQLQLQSPAFFLNWKRSHNLL
ncbi:MAG: thioesterase superfamily protein [Bacteroidota bacterium]|nr:thioesterase superfamily protein [Bacteroidota bacterium]